MAESFHHLSWLIPIISVSSWRVYKHVCRLNHGWEHLIKILPWLGSEKWLCSPVATYRREGGLRSCLLHSEENVQIKSILRDLILGSFLELLTSASNSPDMILSSTLWSSLVWPLCGTLAYTSCVFCPSLKDFYRMSCASSFVASLILLQSVLRICPASSSWQVHAWPMLQTDLLWAGLTQCHVATVNLSRIY